MEWNQNYVGRGGRCQQGQKPSAGDDEVIRQLRYQVNGVDDEDSALAAVDELQYWFRAVATFPSKEKAS